MSTDRKESDSPPPSGESRRNMRDLDPGCFHEEVGDFVEEVIYQQNGAIVYLNKQLELNYCISEADYGTWPPDFMTLEADAAGLQAEPVDHMTKEQLKLFRTLIGQAFGVVLAKGMLDHARCFLKEAAEYYQARVAESFRYRHLLFVLGATVIACFVALIIWIRRGEIDGIVGTDAALILSSSLLASLGVLVSVALRLESIHATTVGSRRLHALESVVRVLVGVIAGLLVILAGRCGLVLNGLVRPETISVVLLLASIAAGLAERSATSLAKLVSNYDGPPSSENGGGAAPHRGGRA